MEHSARTLAAPDPGGATVDGSAGTNVNALYAVLSADWTPEAPVSLLFLHGYGASEQDLAALGPMLALTVPWASLRGPDRALAGGHAWFPLASPDGPDAATGAVWHWIDTYLAPDAKVAAVGFSQGGLMATQLLRTRPEQVAATVLLSGFVHDAPQPADQHLAAERPSLFWARGAQDRMIPADAIERTGRWLADHATLTERVYPRLGHGSSEQEIDDVRAFLIRQLYDGSPSTG
jgi:phospholipase/carboxylesterase